MLDKLIAKIHYLLSEAPRAKARGFLLSRKCTIPFIPLVKTRGFLRRIKKNAHIAVAESCTGGQLSQVLTSISGSSKCFLLGIVAYSNFAKTRILNVPQALIDKHGAVSQAVARKMAQNVAKLAKADLGVGITGIAGPTGGTKAKPVGAVFIAVAAKNKTICKKFNFKGNRSSIRKQATIEALKLLSVILNPPRGEESQEFRSFARHKTLAGSG